MPKVKEKDKSIKRYIEELQKLRTYADTDTSETLDEIMDVLYDYEGATQQTAELIRKYETPAEPIERGLDFYQCPACSKRVARGHSRCHWCGQLIQWRY